MSNIAIKSMQGRSIYPHIRGFTVSRAPRQEDPVQTTRHAAAIAAGTYEAGYRWTRCSPTSWERWRRPVVTDPAVAEAGMTPAVAEAGTAPAVAEAGTAPTAVPVAAPTVRVEALGVVADGSTMQLLRRQAVTWRRVTSARWLLPAPRQPWDAATRLRAASSG